MNEQQKTALEQLPRHKASTTFKSYRVDFGKAPCGEWVRWESVKAIIDTFPKEQTNDR